VTLEQFEAEALKPAAGVRPQLAERLISSLDEDSEIEYAWEDEAERRSRVPVRLAAEQSAAGVVRPGIALS
jgi:hypothetical protein